MNKYLEKIAKWSEEDQVKYKEHNKLWKPLGTGVGAATGFAAGLGTMRQIGKFTDNIKVIVPAGIASSLAGDLAGKIATKNIGDAVFKHKHNPKHVPKEKK